MCSGSYGAGQVAKVLLYTPLRWRRRRRHPSSKTRSFKRGLVGSRNGHRMGPHRPETRTAQNDSSKHRLSTLSNQFMNSCRNPHRCGIDQSTGGGRIQSSADRPAMAWD